MTKRLIIDLAACDQCDSCAVECGGLANLREQVTFELICRRCEHASCIEACPFDALERLADGGVIRRHNLRCVSCKSCAHACPFGTIYPEMLPFYETSCDGCFDVGARHAGDSGSAEKNRPHGGLLHNPLQHLDEPHCVACCPKGALQYREIDADEEDVHIIDEYLAARAVKWVKSESLLEAGS